MLLCLLAYPQEQENRVFHPEARTKGLIIQARAVQTELSYLFPAGAVINESHNGARLYTTSSTGTKLNGGWQSWYPNGLSCDSGRLVKNIPDGEWKCWNEKGQLLAIRHYDAAKFHQVLEEMRRYNPKRNFYMLAALYQQNRPAALQYLDMSYSFPSVRDNNYSSISELVLSNVSGNLYRPVFEQCLQDGLYMNYFDNGSSKDSGYYKNGLRHGLWVHRDAVAANWQQGAYQNGHRVKEWKIYNRDNKLLELIFYTKKGQVSWRKKMNQQDRDR